MHIEFIGLPGAGKTTLRRKLLSSLQQEGEIHCISSEEAFLEVSKRNIDRILRIAIRALPHRLALKFAVKLIDRSRMQFEAQNQFIANHGAALEAFLHSDAFFNMSDIDRQRVIGAFLSMGAMWQCTTIASMIEKVIFLEEGLVQKSFMFVGRSKQNNNDKRRIFDYLENIPKTRLVIYVVASRKMAWNRMLSRPDGLTVRLKNSEESVIDDFLKAAEDHLAVVVEWLTENRSKNLVVLNSEDNSASEFDKVTTRIRRLKA